MPEHLFPGVYVEEVESSAHAIAGVPTSTTAFLGATRSGPVTAPLAVRSFAEFEANFGGLSAELPLGYAVRDYFVNGGREALIGRVVPGGAALTDADLSNPALEAGKRGLWLLDHAEQFDLICIPPLSRSSDVGSATWNAAAACAQQRRAMLIVDPPAAWTAALSISDAAITALVHRSPNAALYYPRLTAPDPLQGNQPASVAPCGAVAGIYARIDAARGVWKAPAGADAKLLGVQGGSVGVTDAQLGALSALGVNGLRTVAGGGIVLWGARTLADKDAEPEWKYVPLRRLELFIATSISRGLEWAVFEPNGPALWECIRASIAHFLHGLFSRGALLGGKAEEAYFVRCDATTMTQQDIEQGVVHVVVGFAPLAPAEFVVLGIGGWRKDHPPASFIAQRYCIRTARYALRVVWDGNAVVGVTRVRGLGQLTELVTVHEGSDPNSPRVIVGPTKFEPVTLERGLTRDNAFERWAQEMQQGGTAPPPRKDVRIELHDRERRSTVVWRLKNALPVKYEAPDFNAAGTDIAIEQLTLAYEGLMRDDPP
jgi:phage tail-like protein